MKRSSGYFLEAGRFCQEAVDDRSVLAFRGEVLCHPEFHFGEPGIVLMTQPPKGSVLESVDFREFDCRRHEQRGLAVVSYAE
jgi:hypothetical protein